MYALDKTLAWLKALRTVLKSPAIISNGDALIIWLSLFFLYWLALIREIGWIDK